MMMMKSSSHVLHVFLMTDITYWNQNHEVPLSDHSIWEYWFSYWYSRSCFLRWAQTRTESECRLKSTSGDTAGVQQWPSDPLTTPWLMAHPANHSSLWPLKPPVLLVFLWPSWTSWFRSVHRLIDDLDHLGLQLTIIINWSLNLPQSMVTSLWTRFLLIKGLQW